VTDFLRDLEAIDVGTSWLIAATVAVLAVALLSLTRRATTFHAADRSVSPVAGGLAASAALLAAAPFLGLAGVLYALGSDGLAWLIGLAAGLVLMGILIAPALRASGALSVPEFLAARYGGRLVALTATLLIGAVCFVLLVVQLAAIGDVVEAAFGKARILGIGGAAVLLAIALAAGGMRSVTWLGIGLGLAMLVATFVPLGIMTMAQHGHPLGPIAYGETLSQLREMEVALISAGLADAVSLKPHLSQFLQVDYANTLALIITVMTGTAVLPHILMRQAVTSGVRETRMTMAWTLLFTAAVLAAVPAYAAMSKHEVYRLVAKGVPVAEVPALFAQENVAVHGVPFSLYGSVFRVLNPSIDVIFSWTDPHVTFGSHAPVDANDPAAIASALKRVSPSDYQAWSRLAPTVQKALLDAAQSDRWLNDDKRFEIWRKTILPVAATAAGNSSGKLTLAAIAPEADTSVGFGLRLADVPAGYISLFALGAVLGAFAAALATAWAVVRCLTCDLANVARGVAAGTVLTGARLPDGARTYAARMIAPLVAFAAAVAAACAATAGAMTVLAWSLTLMAAGLFPALVMGIWWRRATAAGALAGMLAGLAVTLAYIGGSQLVPDALPHVSMPAYDSADIGAEDAATFGGGADTGVHAAEPAFGDEPVTPPAPAAPGDAAPADAGATTEAVIHSGGAWFGIHDTAAAVFGLPLGFLVLILVSLLSRRPSAAADHFVWAIRRPGA
jgi:cation/acetate symporter